MSSQSGTYRALSDDDNITLTSGSLDGKTPVASVYSIDDVLYSSKEDVVCQCESPPGPREDVHDTVKVPGWPADPRKPKSTSKQLVTVLADVACIISSLPFLALALAAIHYTGLEVENGVWKRYQNVSRVVSVIANVQLPGII
jgi:hypothetical protein